MNDRDYIEALERDLKAQSERADRLARMLRKSDNDRVQALEKIEQLRQAICAVTSSANKAQRIINGETE